MVSKSEPSLVIASTSRQDRVFRSDSNEFEKFEENPSEGKPKGPVYTE